MNTIKLSNIRFWEDGEPMRSLYSGNSIEGAGESLQEFIKNIERGEHKYISARFSWEDGNSESLCCPMDVTRHHERQSSKLLEYYLNESIGLTFCDEKYHTSEQTDEDWQCCVKSRLDTMKEHPEVFRDLIPLIDGRHELVRIPAIHTEIAKAMIQRGIIKMDSETFLRVMPREEIVKSLDAYQESMRKNMFMSYSTFFRDYLDEFAPLPLVDQIIKNRKEMWNSDSPLLELHKSEVIKDCHLRLLHDKTENEPRPCIITSSEYNQLFKQECFMALIIDPDNPDNDKSDVFPTALLSNLIIETDSPENVSILNSHGLVSKEQLERMDKIIEINDARGKKKPQSAVEEFAKEYAAQFRDKYMENSDDIKNNRLEEATDSAARKLFQKGYSFREVQNVIDELSPCLDYLQNNRDTLKRLSRSFQSAR